MMPTKLKERCKIFSTPETGIPLTQLGTAHIRTIGFYFMTSFPRGHKNQKELPSTQKEQNTKDISHHE